MRPSPILKVLGILLMFFSISMLTPIIVNEIYQENNGWPFFYSFLITFSSGAILWAIFGRSRQQLTTRDGVIIVILIWSVLCLYGAIPYLFSKGLHISLTHSVFESISGFTATGSTVITGLDKLPKSLLYYRQQSQLFGGMGIVILSVAILPMLGVGGMQLYRAEASGPWKENKLTPRIAETAKALWQIYLFLTLASIGIFWLCGLSLFDSICYAYSTIATGGFAPTDASMSNMPPLILAVSMIFMVLGAISFRLHFLFFKQRSLKVYATDPEFRSFCYFLFFMAVIVILTLLAHNQKDSTMSNFWHGLFQVISFASNTGLTSDGNFYQWPTFIPILLMLIAIIGGCSSSTSSGIKVVRMVLFKKQAAREVRKIVHPEGVFNIKFGKNSVSDRIMQGVMAFFAAYIMVFFAIWLAIMAFHVDVETAFSATVASLSNVGPGLANIGNNFSQLPTPVYWLLDIAMLFGRLEIFTILVLFTKDFWRI